jgi:hypothetical protein
VKHGKGGQPCDLMIACWYVFIHNYFHKRNVLHTRNRVEIGNRWCIATITNINRQTITCENELFVLFRAIVLFKYLFRPLIRVTYILFVDRCIDKLYAPARWYDELIGYIIYLFMHLITCELRLLLAIRGSVVNVIYNSLSIVAMFKYLLLALPVQIFYFLRSKFKR